MCTKNKIIVRISKDYEYPLSMLDILNLKNSALELFKEDLTLSVKTGEILEPLFFNIECLDHVYYEHKYPIPEGRVKANLQKELTKIFTLKEFGAETLTPATHPNFYENIDPHTIVFKKEIIQKLIAIEDLVYATINNIYETE